MMQGKRPKQSGKIIQNHFSKIICPKMYKNPKICSFIFTRLNTSVFFLKLETENI